MTAARVLSPSWMRLRAVGAVHRALALGPVPVGVTVSDSVLRRLSRPTVTLPELARLFPDRSSAERLDLHQEIHRETERSRLTWCYAHRRRPRALRDVVRVSGLDRLDAGPAILLAFHTGAWTSLSDILRWKGCETLVITKSPNRDSAIVLHADSSFKGRTEAAERAIAHLRQGGRVIVAGDGNEGDTGVRVSVLGQRPLMRPGPAALARVGGAPVFPITGAWQGRRLHVDIHEALSFPGAASRDDYLAGAAAVIAGWLDRYLRANPSVLTSDIVGWLLDERR